MGGRGREGGRERGHPRIAEEIGQVRNGLAWTCANLSD